MTPREVFSLKSDAILHEGEKIPYMLIGIIAAGGGKGGFKLLFTLKIPPKLVVPPRG